MMAESSAKWQTDVLPIIMHSEQLIIPSFVFTVIYPVFWLSNLYKWACVTELRVGAGRTWMLLLVSWLAQQLHLQPVEINGGSGQLWLCVEQMAEEWPFLLLWHAQQHTNGSTLITGHIISWSQGSGVVGWCNKGNEVSLNIFSSDLDLDN